MPEQNAVSEGGPPNINDWQIAFEDNFEGNSVDSSKWTNGFGWGSGGSPGDYWVDGNGTLHLEVTQDGNTALHTKDSYTFNYPAYFECKARPPAREGILPSFWSFSTEPTYYPEIDVFELFQTPNDGYHDTRTMHSHVHYTDPADALSQDSAHTSIGTTHDPGFDLTQSMNIYGCKWTEDRLDFYFNGNHVGWITDSTAMESLDLGGPHYLLLSNIVGAVGSPDYSEAWNEEMTVEWVRAWDYDPSANEQPAAAFTTSTDGLTVNLDASDSYDPDGNIDAYVWDFGDGHQSHGPQESHTYSSAGDYTVTLEVRDNDGATATASKSVSVTEPTDPGTGPGEGDEPDARAMLGVLALVGAALYINSLDQQ